MAIQLTLNLALNHVDLFAMPKHTASYYIQIKIVLLSVENCLAILFLRLFEHWQDRLYIVKEIFTEALCRTWTVD